MAEDRQPSEQDDSKQLSAEGLSPEEQTLLESLGELGAPTDDPDERDGEKDTGKKDESPSPDDGLSAEERAMLESLDAPTGVDEGDAKPAAVEPDAEATEAPTITSTEMPSDGLTSEEREMLAQSSEGTAEASSGADKDETPVEAAEQPAESVESTTAGPTAAPEEELTPQEREMPAQSSEGTAEASDGADKDETPVEAMEQPDESVESATAGPMAAPEDGLTPEEREMLASLSGGSGGTAEAEAPPSEPEAAPGPVGGPVETSKGDEDVEADEESLTPEEREMLAMFSEGTAEATPAETAEIPEPAEPSEAPAEAPTEEALSPQEAALLESAKAEGERVVREDLPQMFEGGDVAAGADEETPFLAETLEEAAIVDGEGPWEPGGRLGRIIAAPFDAINYPFRQLSPVVRLGLGLCGVLLLLTLFLIKLLQVLAG